MGTFQKIKALLFAAGLLISWNNSNAQSCEITVQGQTPSCPGNLLVLSVEESDSLKYLWSPGEDTLATIAVRPEETTEYRVLVYNDNYECRDSVTIEVYPEIEMEFEQLQKTCTGTDTDCKAKVKAIAGGEFPADEYDYEWEWNFFEDADSTIAIGLCGDVQYSIRVWDPYGCYVDTNYQVESFLSPTIDIWVEPDSIVYIKNPWITFYYADTTPDTLDRYVEYHTWDFGDSVTSNMDSPRHLFDRIDVFNASITITDNNGCDTTYFYPVEVKPVELIIPNVFTPNGDGINETLAFTADNPEGADPEETLDTYYISNELVVFNRYGRKVYEKNNYMNDWDGGNLPDGVYFFVLKCHGEFGDDVFKGSVTILGRNN